MPGVDSTEELVYEFDMDRMPLGGCGIPSSAESVLTSQFRADLVGGKIKPLQQQISPCIL